MDRRTFLAALDGEPEATTEFVRHMKNTLRPFFARYFLDGDINDSIHSTIRDLIKKIDEAPDDPDSFDRWVFGFARTQARATAGERKREAARALRHKQYANDPVTSMREQMERLILRSQQQQLVLHCMLELPDIYREAIEHNLDGGDHQSLARQSGISVAAARFRLWKGRRLLHKLVADARKTPDTSPAHQTS